MVSDMAEVKTTVSDRSLYRCTSLGKVAVESKHNFRGFHVGADMKRYRAMVVCLPGNDRVSIHQWKGRAMFTSIMSVFGSNWPPFSSVNGISLPNLNTWALYIIKHANHFVFFTGNMVEVENG